MKKINVVIVVLFMFSVLSCTHDVPDKKESYVHSVIDSLRIEKTFLFIPSTQMIV